ncbi:MAG: response regulator [Anaerolineaceae bacterium]|nr:response regulator [Anaerolineaceae bacterium]
METKPLALIIEDDVDQNLIFTTALEQAGYKTESIQDGLTAQQRLTETVPKVVVLDLHIPEIAGKTLLRQIRNDQRLTNVRVLLATADAALADSLRAEADIILLKPISFSQLSVLASRFISV